jgi:ferritin
MIIVDYVLKRGAEVKITAIPAPPENPENMNSCLEEVNDVEVIYTKGILDIVKMSSEEEDWTTHKFIQSFVVERVEEETFAKSLLNKMEKSNNEKAADNSVFEPGTETVNISENVSSGTNIRLQNPNINGQQQ